MSTTGYQICGMLKLVVFRQALYVHNTLSARWIFDTGQLTGRVMLGAEAR